MEAPPPPPPPLLLLLIPLIGPDGLVGMVGVGNVIFDPELPNVNFGIVSGVN